MNALPAARRPRPRRNLLRCSPEGYAATNLAPGEVILAVNGRAVRSRDDLVSKIASLGPGTAERLVVFGGASAPLRSVSMRSLRTPTAKPHREPPALRPSHLGEEPTSGSRGYFRLWHSLP